MGMLDDSYFPQNTGTAGNAALGFRSFLNLLGGRVTSPNELYQEDQTANAMQQARLNYLQQQGEAHRMNNLESQQKMELQRAAMEQARRQQMQQQQYLSSLRQPSPGVSPEMALMQGAQSGDVGPTISNQMRIAAPDPGNQFNPLDAIRNGFDLKSAQEMAGMNNWGRAKVSHFQDTRGPNGVQVTGFNEYGDAVQTGQTPFKAPEKLDLGGSVQMYDPVTGEVTGKFGKTMTPGEAASNAVAWANNSLGQQRLAFDKTQSGPAGTNKAPAGYRWKPDGSLEPIPGGPQDLKAGSQSAKQADAKDVLSLLDMAEPLIKKATGSYAGAGADMAANVFGFSTEGANAASQLQALEGMLVSKMPKMSGPQSDKDVLLYKQMAGQIGNPTVPAERKLAAMQTIRQINQIYAGNQSPQQASSGTDLSRADREASLKNARNAILRNPSQKEAIIQRLEQNGITNHGLR